MVEGQLEGGDFSSLHHLIFHTIQRSFKSTAYMVFEIQSIVDIITITMNTSNVIV